MRARPWVLIADDHSILVAGLRHLLEKDFEIAGTVSTGSALVSEAMRLQPDMIVTDISMPVMNGLEAIRRIHSVHPEIRIVVLTMHDSPLHVKDAREAGASGYVVKRHGPEVLMRALQKVAAGGQAFPAGTEVVPAMTGVPEEAPVRLTNRQREVLILVVQGCSLKEVAARLGISQKTVEFHKTGLKELLEVKSTAELIACAIRQGLVDAGASDLQGINKVPRKNPSPLRDRST